MAGMTGTAEPAFCLVSPDGIVLSCSVAMATLLGRDREKIVDRPCREVFACTEDDEARCPLARAMADHQPAEAVFRRQDRRLVESAEPLLDTYGMTMGVVLSLRDPGAAVIRGPDLVRLQRLTAIAQAASGVVHDFNSLFAQIGGAVALLKSVLPEKGDDPLPSQLVTTINEALEQGRTLTSHLLDFGKGRGPGKADVAIADAIRRGVAFAARSAGRQPELKLPADLWTVRANIGQVVQLVGNLVLNALQATPADRRVAVSAENVPAGGGGKAGTGTCRYVRLVVRDEGCGIPQSHMGRLFDPFFTTRPQGTGLGLATVNLIVQEHGGRIDVDSTEGRGTTITVDLPAPEPVGVPAVQLTVA